MKQHLLLTVLGIMMVFGFVKPVFATDVFYDFEFANIATRLEHSRVDVVTGSGWYVWWDDSEICDTGNATLSFHYATGTQFYSTGSQQCNESGTAGTRGGLPLINVLAGQPAGTYTINLTASSSPTTTWYDTVYWNGSEFYDAQATRIVSVVPPNGSTVSTSSAITVGATIYIDENDYEEGMYLYMSFTNQTTLAFGMSAIQALPALEIRVPITTSGLTVFATTTATSTWYIGDTFSNYSIRKDSVWDSVPVFNYFFSGQTLVSTSTKFTIGQKTEYDNAVDSTSMVDYLLTGTTTVPILTCNLIDSFELEKCLVSLIVPPSSIIVDKSKQAFEIVSRSWPLGYISRFVVLMGTPATSTLPILGFTFKSSSPITGDFAWDLGSSLVRASTYLTDEWTTDNGLVETDGTKNIWDIFMPYLSIFGYLGLFLYIVGDLMGMSTGGTHMFGKGEKRTGITKDEYAYKEKLYELSQRK